MYCDYVSMYEISANLRHDKSQRSIATAANLYCFESLSFCVGAYIISLRTCEIQVYR